MDGKKVLEVVVYCIAFYLAFNDSKISATKVANNVHPIRKGL